MSATPAAVGTGSHVFFEGDDRLEGTLDLPGPGPEGAVAAGAVVAHPHPLYGGTMAQPVVYRVAKACQKRGMAALRFNFRGVGGSAGRYSGHDEHRDVEAALAYLRGRLSAMGATPHTPPGESQGRAVAAVAEVSAGSGSPGGRPPALAVAGYSFGSVMAAMAAGGSAVAVDALVLVAFPVGWDELPPDLFTRLARFKGPVLAVCGEADDLGPPWEVERALSSLGLDCRIKVVRGAGHLFEGRQFEVADEVGDFLQTALRSRGGPV